MSLANLPRRVHLGIAALLATGFFVLMALAILATPGLQQEGQGGAEDLNTLADSIFDTHVIALEALGVLLTAALIGAMVIARPLGTQPDSVNYPTKRDAAGLEELQSASDVDRNLRDGTFFAYSASETVDTTEEEE